MPGEPNYTSFLGTGHASAGHWNDPPTQVFKPNDRAILNSTPSSQVSTDSEPIGDEIIASTQLYNRLLALLGNLPPQPKRPDYPRRVKDVQDRIQQIPQLELPLATLEKLSAIITCMEKGEFSQAMPIHTQMMLENYGPNSKWLIGLKRLIELLQG